MEGRNIETTKRSKPLEIGSTKIGVRSGKHDGVLKTFSIYYGNYVDPPVKGKHIHLKPSLYYEILNKFLHTEEGKEYIYPSKEEIEDATRLVISSESQRIIEKRPVKEESKNPQETIVEEIDPISIDQDFSNHNGNLKVLVGIVIIQFVCIVGLIAMMVIRK